MVSGEVDVCRLQAVGVGALSVGGERGRMQERADERRLSVGGLEKTSEAPGAEVHPSTTVGAISPMPPGASVIEPKGVGTNSPIDED